MKTIHTYWIALRIEYHWRKILHYRKAGSSLLALYQFIRCYCLDHRIPAESIIFPLTERAVQKHLKLVCDYLGYHGISTHSFRKFYATEIYKDSGYNIALVQQLLQHSSAAVTQRYIGIQQQELEQAIEGHLMLDF